MFRRSWRISLRMACPQKKPNLAYLFPDILDGRNASLADGIQALLGRGPFIALFGLAAVAATGLAGTNWINNAENVN
jgi:hypothetical protein